MFPGYRAIVTTIKTSGSFGFNCVGHRGIRLVICRPTNLSCMVNAVCTKRSDTFVEMASTVKAEMTGRLNVNDHGSIARENNSITIIDGH